MTGRSSSAVRAAGRLVLLVALLVMLAGGVAGAATSGASPTKWASTFCGSFLTWEQAAKTGDAKLTKVLNALQKSGHANLTDVRSQLVGFLGDFESATGRLQTSLEAVGPPAVTNGGKIQAILTSGIVKAQAALATAKNKAKALPTNNAAAFVRGTTAITKSFTATFNKVGNSFSALKKYSPPSLTAAAKADPACKKLAG